MARGYLIWQCNLKEKVKLESKKLNSSSTLTTSDSLLNEALWTSFFLLENESNIISSSQELGPDELRHVQAFSYFQISVHQVPKLNMWKVNNQLSHLKGICIPREIKNIIKFIIILSIEIQYLMTMFIIISWQNSTISNSQKWSCFSLGVPMCNAHKGWQSESSVYKSRGQFVYDAYIENWKSWLKC